MSTCAVIAERMSANAVEAVTQTSMRVRKQTIGEACLQCGELAFWKLAKGCEMSLPWRAAAKMNPLLLVVSLWLLEKMTTLVTCLRIRPFMRLVLLLL
jgi:hypothetical protein